jgi:CheY-like chemotaxis protein
MKTKKSIHILIAEDDADDKLLIIKAFQKTLAKENITCVTDGEELINYLQKSSNSENSLFPIPDIILLDLNMPRKDGMTTLQEIKSHEEFRKIPVIIFTTSSLNEDIQMTYKMGTNSFITKPGNFKDLVKITQEINNYWSNTVILPNKT